MRLLCAVAISLLLATAPATAFDAVAAAPARRIVSMNPSLTRILVAIGAKDALVGVDEFSARAEPAVASLPRVGGLYSPSLESVVALAPDLVVIVPSLEQREFRTRLERAEAFPFEDFDPVRFEQVLDTIGELGAARRSRGRGEDARRRDPPRARCRAARHRRPRAAARGAGAAARAALRGGTRFVPRRNARDGGRRATSAPNWARPGRARRSSGWSAAGPEVILDSDSDPAPAARYWARWPSLPAVEHGRIVAVNAGDVTLPGPDLDKALVTLARALHGNALPLDALVAP